MRPPTQQEEKPQLDGVLPQNHPDVYEALLKETTMCITAINEEETIYREKDIPYRRVCDECFWDIALDIHNFIEEVRNWHTLCKVEEQIQGIKRTCYCCGKIILNLRPVKECIKCVEEFINNEEEFYWKDEINVRNYENIEN
ncbi:hypothetical protein P5V15_015138 [Pogonomyrmex californicus]